jgi:hypothetical protein
VNTTYLRYEILRVVRARRFVVFSIAFPLILYYLIAARTAPNTTSAAAASRRRST